MFKWLLAPIIILFLTLALAGNAKADDCGYWKTYTEYVPTYVQPRVIGYDVYRNPIYTGGYYVYTEVTRRYWVSAPCYRPRYRYYGPRLRFGFNFLFR